MNPTLSLGLTEDQAVELQGLLERCTQEVRAANARMERDEAERLQLQAETRVLLEQIKELLHVEKSH
jgi:hypothetical protein